MQATRVYRTRPEMSFGNEILLGGLRRARPGGATTDKLARCEPEPQPLSSISVRRLPPQTADGVGERRYVFCVVLACQSLAPRRQAPWGPYVSPPSARGIMSHQDLAAW